MARYKNENASWKIERTGAFFRATSNDGFCSAGFTSASQAGLLIERLAGKDAHRAAAEAFIAEVRK